MKFWHRVCSMLLALALVFGLVPAVRPIVAEAAVADTPEGVRNHLPSKATDVVYLSDTDWVHSVNNGDVEATRNVTWSSGEAIIMGDIAANGGTTFEKGLGVQPDATMNASHEGAMQTVFDLADNGYKQSFFYAAAGITNDAAKQSGSTIGNGVYFAVWASYDKAEENYAQAEYVLLETSPQITNGIVHQFHLDISGVRYLKLVVYAAQEDVSNMDCAWAGACVYNNTGYYPKSDLMGLNNGKKNSTWVPTGTTRFHTYHFNNIPADATYLSGTDYKNTDGTLVEAEDGDKVMVASSATNLGTGNRWLGGATDQITGLEGANTTDGICCTDASKYLRFNATEAVDGVAEGWVTFNISGLDVNRFYAVIGSGNDTAKHSAYNPASGTCGGVVCQVLGAETEDGAYELLSESEPIMLSQTGEFLVDITGVNYLKLRVQLKDYRSISFMDTLIFSPCVFQEWDVTASGQSSVLRGLNANYTATVRRDLTTDYDYTGTITWDLEGTDNQGTTMEDGKLTVAANESADELKITATINEGGKTITSDPITVNVVKSATGVRDHLPSIAQNVAYLSDMTWVACDNYNGVATTKNYAWNDSTAPIVLGDIAANGGTTFMKGLGVMPKGTDASNASYTVFDLQNYSRSFFYSAAGITNDTAKNSKSAENVTNGVIFAVYASYDTNEDANYVLLEKSDTLTKGLVHQFHLDVTGVRYLKLVVYAAQEDVSNMDCAWAGACVYNNPGYQPKTDMFGSCNGDEGKYVAPENPTMFNIYQFENLPADAVTLAQQERTETEVYTEEGDASFGTHAGWVGGTHLPVKDKAGVIQDKTWQKDGIKFPAESSLYFNARDNDISDGYVVYDVSELGMDTFYCIVGAVNQTYKWSDYDPATGDFGGMIFEVWGNYAEDGEYTQLSESEPILKSNTGEFLLDITGVHSLKLRIRAKDTKTHGYLTGGFVYASVFNQWGIEVTGASSVTKGTSADYAAVVRQDLTIDKDYAGAVTWTIAEDTGNTGATITDAGLLTVPSTAAAGATLTITATITPEEGETVTSDPITVTVTSVPAGVRNHLPTTAKDIVYLSDMDWEYSENYHETNFNDRGWHFVKDEEWWSGGAIILGATSEANGGTKFAKGLGVMPNNTDKFTSNTVFDLADNNYEQSFFYSAAGITNTNGILYAEGDAMSNGSTFAGAGVIFEVWASYDKSEDNYASANYELLESSDEITKGLVYQFHLDVTGVRYLMLVTRAVGNISSMNSAWGGTCVYNNSGYYPKTDMFGDFNGDNAAYEEPADPTMFNTYQFENLPTNAVSLLPQDPVGTYTPGIGKDACWIGGTHVAVNGLEYDSMKDGIKLPKGSSPYFKNYKASDSNSAAEGYVIYDVSSANADTFYAMIGVTDQTFKYSDYDPETGDYGGVVFDVWGKYEGSDDFELLCSSEVITKSNSGEFIVDITGVQQLKIRHYQKDPRAKEQTHGCFGYASVYKEDWTVTASGEDAVLQGMKADYTAEVTRKLIPGDYYHYTGDIAWDVEDELMPGTTMEDGKLTVDSYETASSVKVTASICEGGATITATKAVAITPTGDCVAYVEQTGYKTLAEAVAVAADKTVVMVKDVTQEAPVDLNADVEWNLNGKTVSGDTLMTLGENAKLNIVGDGGSLDGKLKLTASGAEITADTAIAVEINGCDATVTGKNVTLTDSATDNGETGGKIYGSFTADTVSQNGSIRYVILSGTDENGDAYKTANAVRVRLIKVSIRPSAAGIYYTAQLKFNANVVNAGATYGVVLSVYDEIGENFMRETNAEGSRVNLWTSGTPTPDENFISNGNSCLVKNILLEGRGTELNSACGMTGIYANAYVKLTVGGEELTFMAENTQPVVYSMASLMQGFDAKLGAGTLEPTLKTAVVNFYKSWKDVMAQWELTNIHKAYESAA